MGSTPPCAWLVLPGGPSPLNWRLWVVLERGRSWPPSGLSSGPRLTLRRPHGCPSPASSHPISQNRPTMSVHMGLRHHVQLHVYVTDEETEAPSRKEGQGYSQASCIQQNWRAHLLSASSGRRPCAHPVMGNPQSSTEMRAMAYTGTKGWERVAITSGCGLEKASRKRDTCVGSRKIPTGR